MPSNDHGEVGAANRVLTSVLLAWMMASCAPLEQQSSLLCSQLLLAEEK